MPSRESDPLASIRWWWRDWRASTARAVMTPLARLAYLELLFASHGEPGCALPAEDAKLAALAGVSAAEWASIRGEVLPYFETDTDGRIFNERMRNEWRRACGYRALQRRKGRGRLASLSEEERSELGRKGAAARWLHHSDGCQPDASRACQPDASLPSPSPSPSPSPYLKIPPTPLPGGSAPAAPVVPKSPRKRTDPLALDLKRRLGCGTRMAEDQIRALRAADWDDDRIQSAIESHAEPGLAPWDWTKRARTAEAPHLGMTDQDRATLEAARRDYA